MHHNQSPDLSPGGNLHYARGGNRVVQRSGNSPRAAASTKPISTMNLLLAIAILLQMYQIYRSTPTDVKMEHQLHNLQKDSSFDFQRGLRRAFDDPPPQQQQQEQEPGSLNFRYPTQDLVPEQQAYHMVQDEEQEEQEESQQAESYAEAVRRHKNLILYGNEDGPVDLDQQQLWYQFLNNGNATAPEDFNEPPFIPSKYNYSQLATAARTNYTLPTEPRPTNQSNMAIIVLSSRSNFDRRQTIRETWAKGHDNVYFIVGGPEPDNLEDIDMSNVNSTSNRLFREQKQYHDLLDTVAPDSYKGLPYKVHFAIEWIANHPQMKHTIEWILKVDDDVVVRINTLQYYVVRKYNPMVPIVIGRIDINSKPHRTGKWAEDPKFVHDEYPPWAYGSTGYVISRPVIDYVASHFEQRSLYYYQGEDVSLGIWLYESPLDVTWIASSDFNLENQKWYNHKYSAVIGHDLSLEEMRGIFDKWKDPKPTIVDFYHANHTKIKGHIYEEQHKYAFDEDPNHYLDSDSDPYDPDMLNDGYDTWRQNGWYDQDGWHNTTSSSGNDSPENQGSPIDVR